MKSLLHAAVAVLTILLFFIQPKYGVTAVPYKYLNIAQYLYAPEEMKPYSSCARTAAGFMPPKYKKDPDVDSELLGQEPLD